MDFGQGAGERSSKMSAKTSTSLSNNDVHADILADLEASFKANQEQSVSASSSASHPLLTRLNQNSAERAHVAAVGHQLGPEGALAAPRVIGDFVGLHSNIDARSSTAGAESMSEALDNIRLGGLDDAFNDLDAVEGEEYEDVGDFGLHLSQGLSLQADDNEAERGRRSKGKQVVASSMATSVDPTQLYGATGEGSTTPWEIAAGLEPSMQDDDDDELDLDVDDPAIEELGLALAPKSKREKKKMQKKGIITYPPEVQKLLGLANNAYVNRDYDQAVDYFQQVIVTHPNVFQAWNIMGVIQEELGNTEKALQLYLVAAHLTPKDGALWKKLAVISKDCGYDQQALYCFTRAFRADKNDMDALWDRSIMYQILNEPFKAIQGFQKLLKVKHHYMPALEELVKLYSSLDQDNKKYRENMHQAMLDYEAAYLHYSSLPDKFSNNSTDPFDVAHMDYDSQQSEPFGYSALNMLSELYIMFEEYEKPIEMIKTWSRRLQRRSHQTWWDDYKDDREFDTEPDDEELQASLGDNRTRGLPIDLRVKLGICRLMMEEVKEAKAQFKYLWRCSVEDFPDLYEEIAELYVTKQMWKDGYNVIRAMLQYDEMDVPKIWIMAGECLRHMRQFKEAKDYLEQAHRADPDSVELSMMLAEVYEETGQLQQALKLANFVRRVNAEKQAEADQRRKEAKAIRDAKNKDAPSTPRTPASTSNLPVNNYGYRELAPRQTTTSDAAKNALARITEASRNRTAAERYNSADRDRDIQYVRAAREQERADKLAGREFHTQELREVIEKFNRVDLIFQRIDEKEKSKVWESKREAVEFTREDRTQYIQVARELIDMFMGNRAFFVKEKMKPYMGAETRAWRYRRSHKEDQDIVLSEHASEMSDRLGRMMGLAPPKPVVPETVEAAPPRAPATSYKDVPFDAWYLLMIRQAVYLTFEHRYEEAIDLLMVMYSANVFYAVPRRRSGIMLVVLSCSMWVGDYDATINAGRWLCNFGGVRPFALKLFQSIFTHGPRGHQRFFAWVQANTYKYLKRSIDTMRSCLGSKAHAIRKIHKVDRKATVYPKRRGPRKSFPILNPSLASPKKRLRGDTEASPAKTAAFPWRGSSNVLQAPVTIAEAVTANTSRQSTRSRLSNMGKPAAVDEDPFTETGTPTSSSNGTGDTVNGESNSTATTPAAVDGSSKTLRPKVTFAEADNAGTISDAALDAGSDNTAANGEGRVLRRKRRLEVEDTAETDIDESGEDVDDEDEGDDDDYDIHDEAYRTDEEEGKEAEHDPEEYETEWDQDDPDFPRPNSKGFGKRRGGPLSGTGSYADDYEDEEGASRGSSRGSGKGGRKKSSAWRDQYKQSNRSDSQGGVGDDLTEKRGRGMKMFTKDVFPKFQMSLVMFMGHILSHSRTHRGSAIHMAECMEYAPKNPMIQLYLSVQFFNLAMQRTTTNRQVVMGQALVFLQNYYHLRMAGRGSIAFSEREKLSKAKGTSTEAAAGTDAPVFPIIKSKSDDWKDQAEKASAEAVRASSSTSDGSSKPTTLTEPSSTKTTPALIGLPSSLSASSSSFTELPRLAQCQQEAEYNFARAFHQIGQKNLAIIHYRRVLELPSWRQVEREQEAARKVQEQALKDVRWQERATARSAAIERKMERAHHIRQLREAKQALKEEAKKQKLEEKAARAEAKAMAIASGVAAIAEDEDDVEEEVEEMDEDLDDYAEEPEDEDEDILSDDERQGDEASAPPILTRIQVQGEEDEDPTDLKREAAYNLAKIYMLSGAMGEAQLLMRKYCTL